MLNIRAQRLAHQHLSTPDLKAPVQVVRWFGAVQAQDYQAAKWGLALRMSSVNERLIERAFDNGEILRTHVLRPTWHFVAPEDIRWMLRLTGPRIRKQSESYFRQTNLDSASLRRTEKVLSRILKNQNFLTRSEIRAAFVKSGIEPGESTRLGYILVSAELEGLICSGGKKGKQFTYSLLDERAPVVADLSRDESKAELARRYFRSHGPATIADFAWWSGLTKRDAGSGIEMLGSEVRATEVEGKQVWFMSETDNELLTAHLLPPYDEYLVAYADRSAASEFVPQGQRNIIFGPTVAVNGKVVGTWSRETSSKSAVVLVTPFIKLKRLQWTAIEHAVSRYGEFLGLTVELRRDK